MFCLKFIIVSEGVRFEFRLRRYKVCVFNCCFLFLVFVCLILNYSFNCFFYLILVYVYFYINMFEI